MSDSTASPARGSDPTASPARGSDTDLCYTPATELAALIRARKLSPVELTRAVLERIERLNPRLNAFCTLTAEAALARAREAEAAVTAGRPLGPLHGVPYSIKDLALTRGVRTMGGSAIFADRVPDADAPFVARLAAAGGIFLGKTTTPEFGWKGLGDSPVSGITRNPWNPAMTTGGSSAGAGAAAAAGLGPLHHGSDGAGSIRIPSAFCGVFGLKPSYGRVPQWPVSNNDQTTHNGPMTRTVADAALMLAVMAGPDERDRTSLEAPPADYVGGQLGTRARPRAPRGVEPRPRRAARGPRGPPSPPRRPRARSRSSARTVEPVNPRLRRHPRDDPLPLVGARGRQLRPVPRRVARAHGPGARRRASRTACATAWPTTSR